MEVATDSLQNRGMTDYEDLLDQAIACACEEIDVPSEELILAWFYRILIEGGHVTVH